MRKTDELIQLANEVKQEYEINRKKSILRGYSDAIREIEIYSLMEHFDKEELKIMKKLVRHMEKEKERIKHDMGL